MCWVRSQRSGQSIVILRNIFVVLKQMTGRLTFRDAEKSFFVGHQFPQKAQYFGNLSIAFCQHPFPSLLKCHLLVLQRCSEKITKLVLDETNHVLDFVGFYSPEVCAGWRPHRPAHIGKNERKSTKHSLAYSSHIAINRPYSKLAYLALSSAGSGN